MRTGKCECDNRLFFGNFKCLKCGRDVGQCDRCSEITSFGFARDDKRKCFRCDALSYQCSNHAQMVCNAYVGTPNVLCRWCRFTTVAPDSNKPGNLKRWATLEYAKRRLLLELQSLQLPPFVNEIASSHPLTFQFLEDSVDVNGQVQPVMTGHDMGLITINLMEAESVQREKLRVEFGEPQRTLIGHMRHEIGHYIDWVYASRIAPDEYNRLFGNPYESDYDVALKRHYEQGAPVQWDASYVSAYATMHPWEDFAETVNAYLDIMAIGATAVDQGLDTIDLSPHSDPSKIVQAVLQIAVTVSEFNFDLGLPSLLPERLSPAVIEKLSFVHRLRSPESIAKLEQLEATTGA
jgi:hypothetical protein